MTRIKIWLALTEPNKKSPKRRFTRVRLYSGGKEGFAQLEHRIRKAAFSVYIDMFIWENDETGRMVALWLLEAADRGVKIEISKDSIGDAFELNNDIFTTVRSADPMWSRFWSHENINISHSQEHNHSKVFIVDEKYLLITGLNISDRYRLGHDYLVEVYGRSYVRAYLSGEDPRNKNIRLVMNSSEKSEARPVVTQLLKSAKKQILVEQIFLSDKEVIDILVRKSHEGVTIAALLPKAPGVHHYSNLTAAEDLLKRGNPDNILLYFRRNYTHAKAILVDRHKALVGSVNLIQSSLDQMGEVAVLVQGRPGRFHLRLRMAMERGMLQSDVLKEHPRLTFLQRLYAKIGF